MKRFLSTALTLMIFGSMVFGQTPDEIVTAKVILTSDVLKAGQTVPVTIELMIRPPYHINSDQPSEAYLIGTTLDFKPRSGVTYGAVRFPPSEMRKLALAENPLSIFEGTVKLTSEITVAADFSGTEMEIEGTVGYQACDEQSCLPPKDISFSKKVTIDGGRAAAPGAASPETKTSAQGNAPIADAANPIPAAASAESKAAPAQSSPFEGKGLPVIFVLVFLGGLALNLTPCIYPIIPITISYFGGQAEGKKGGVVAHAIFYVFGMAITYSVLGVVAAFTGGLFGAALTFPPVLIAIALIMVILSLSMFDVYELRMPAFLNKLAGGTQKGYFGTILMGLTVGIVAAPCIGPFVLGLLTYVGNRGNVILGFSLFFVLALGLGVPFLILGIFSGSLNKLPRSGAWMVWVRKNFGFILIAMAVYFLKSLIPNTLHYHFALAMIMLIGGIYMGWIEPTKTVGKVFPYIRVLIGIVFLLLSLVFAVTGVEEYLETTIAAKTSGSGGIVAGAITWVPYSEEALASALASGSPVFIDSDAEWCIACHELDKKTFNQPEIVAASRAFVMLKADLTSNADPKTKAFYKKYNARGVPTMIFIKPDGAEIPELRGVGFEPKDVFLGKMKKALELSGFK
jgi:thiol:disulfide interchange protein DsbD